MSATRNTTERLGIAWVGGAMAVFLAVPVVALFATTTLDEVARGLSHPLVWPALRLTLLTTTTSLVLVVVLGTPLSWWLASTAGRWARIVESVTQLPSVIPPAVAGVALLLAFGRRGWLAAWLEPAGVSLAFTTSAVVVAEVFVSAPFYVQAATSAFRRIDPKLLLVARTFGASPLRVLMRVAVPLAAPGLWAGAAMSWARSLGEFGATLMFAGNLEGRTQTLPLAIYTTLESDLRAAQALSIVLVVIAAALLLLARLAQRDAAVETGTLVLVGPNGAGKSSLLSLILGAVPAQAGRIAVGSQVLFDSTARVDVPVEQRRIGYVPQDYALLPHLNVRQNVSFAIGSTGLVTRRAERARRTHELLCELGIEALGGRRTQSLSGGEKQRVALARALSVAPRALLLDEPLAALDVHARGHVRALLADSLRRLGLPTIVVTHDPEDARVLGQAVAVLEQGRVTQHGTWDALCAAPKTPFVSELTTRAR